MLFVVMMKMSVFSQTLFWLVVLCVCCWSKPLPIVLWHGMGDTCCNPESMGYIKDYLQKQLDGVYVYSINTGDGGGAFGFISDTISGYLGNANSQVEKVCTELKTIPELQDGYNALGFSQGGQFLRGLVEKCQESGPKMRTLVTFGGQHQGVMNVPGCTAVVHDNSGILASASQYLCTTMQYLLGLGAYIPYVQFRSIQAQYFKDPFEFEEYVENSIYLAEINNDKSSKNSSFAKNLASLDKFVMVKFLNDTMVVPKESSWFGYFNGSQLLTLQEQDIYKEDWIGLKKLDEENKLVFLDKIGNHLQISMEWMDQYIIQPYLTGQPPAHVAQEM